MIRKAPIAWTPEEKVRQELLYFMINEAGYPASLIAVELALSSLPHLASQKVPNRRADILIFSRQMEPLVLVECKAVPITSHAIRQLMGYNLFVKAPYLVLANHQEVKTAQCSIEGCSFSLGIPTYQQIERNKK